MTAVRLAPGEGYVLVDGRSMLFLPSWDERLAAAFTDNGEGARRQAVASAATEAAFEVAPFVCVVWIDELHLMVFGEIAVETTAAALPMLTGAGSRTWVERTVELDDVDVDVCAGSVDSHTRLVAGTALAGGFRLELRPSSSDAARRGETAGGAETADTGTTARTRGDQRNAEALTSAETPISAETSASAETPTPPPSDDAARDQTAAAGMPVPPTADAAPRGDVEGQAVAGESTHGELSVDGPAPDAEHEPSADEPTGDEPSGGVADADAVPAPTSGVPLSGQPMAPPAEPPSAVPKAPPKPANDPQVTIDAIHAAAVGDDGVPLVESESQLDAAVDAAAPGQLEADVLDDPNDSDITLPPPEPVGIPHDEEDGEAGVRVEAKPCSAGHLSPPAVASCELCGELLSPDAASVVHVARPSLGAIELDDGTTCDLTDDLLLGRNPATGRSDERADMQPVKTPGDKVSRVHVEIRLQGWDVLVGDCGSTNGTFVVPYSGGNVLQLEPGRLHIVEDGATVYFGSRSFQVVGRRIAT